MSDTIDLTTIFEAINDIIKSKTEGMSIESVDQIYGYSVEQINRLVNSIKNDGHTDTRNNLLKLYLKNLADIQVENSNRNLIRIAPEQINNKRHRH